MVMTKKGGETLRQTMIEKHGSEEAWKAVVRENGRKGGSVSTPTGGFGASKERAITSGSIGGRYSRRGHKIIERHDTYGLYTKTATGETVKIDYR